MEFSIHLTIWIAAVLYSLYTLFSFTKRVDLSITDLTEDFKDGWLFIGRLKDVSDFEWNTWKVFILDIWPWLLFHFGGAELLRFTGIGLSKIWYIFVSFSLILFKFGPLCFLILLFQPCLYLLIIHLGGKLKSVWISSCLILLIINILKFQFENVSNNSISQYKFVDQKDLYMMMVSISWVHLRCLSFTLEFINTDVILKGKELLHTLSNREILNMLSYTFYLPLFFLGPVMLYNDFLKSFDTPLKFGLRRRLFCFIRNFSRYMGWFLFTELCLHFVYFNALQFYTEIIEMMPDWCLYGGGMWMGLYFYLKYLVVYGLAGTVTALDHMEPTAPPRCIARVHRYSQMWKHFDVGLHKFLLRYIYKPVINNVDRRNVVWLSFMRGFASFLCFTFVFFWHGAHGFILIWTILNYLGILLESFATTISQSEFYRNNKSVILRTESMNDRFNAFLSTPVLIISALSNFYFFAGSDVGYIFVHRVFNQSFASFIVMFICLYSSCRVSQKFAGIDAKKILT